MTRVGTGVPFGPNRVEIGQWLQYLSRSAADAGGRITSPLVSTVI